MQSIEGLASVDQKEVVQNSSYIRKRDSKTISSFTHGQIELIMAIREKD